MSGPHIWNIEKEKGREKEKVGNRRAKLNKNRSDRELERERKRKKEKLLEKQHENFVAAVRKWEMLAVTTLKVSGCEKKGDTNTYDISSIKRVTRKFLGVLRCSRAKQQQRNVQKKCAARAKLLIRAVVVL